jgi:aldehyde:ferredoxin oxidoreductase
MDTISTGGVLGFAHYLYDQGIIGIEETGGHKLHWGDDALVAQLIPLIARREGFGAVLAEGTRAMEQRFAVPGLAVQINGMDPGMHDPRGISGMAAVYLTSPRGACHNKSDFYFIAAGHSYPEIGVEFTDPKASQDVAHDVVRHQNWRSFVDSSGSCLFVNSPVADLVEMVNAATGWTESVRSLSEAGERIHTLKRLINLKLGWTRADEVMPKLLTTPLQAANSEGFVPDSELILREYYRAREWDILTGRPSAARLAALRLDEFI